MANRRRLAIFVLCAAALVAQPVFAADDEAMALIQNAPEYVPEVKTSGWYLRGDIGYSAGSDLKDISISGYNGFEGSPSLDSVSLDENFTLSAGIGYVFTDYLRGDLTVDGFRAGMSGTGLPGYCPSISGCTLHAESKANVVSVMANGYVDLGTFAGLTPYVGAGAGVSHVDWSRLETDIECDGICSESWLDANGSSDWRFTYALMAGVSYDVSDRMKIDLGYKFRHINGGDAFAWENAGGAHASDGGMSQHEIKVGLRYAF